MTEKEDEISIYSDITDIDEQFETVTSPKPGTKAEGYSPANPEIAPASLYYIQLVPGEIQVNFEQRMESTGPSYLITFSGIKDA